MTSIKIKELERILDKKYEIDYAAFNKETESYIDAFAKVGDREFVIIAACWLDNLLERLISASFIKTANVKAIFKDEHILQSFYTKIQISYFSGLIPKWLCNDLKLICQIRNRFAHGFEAMIRLKENNISSKINRLELRPKTLDDVDAPRLKFMVSILITALLLHHFIKDFDLIQPKRLVDILESNDWDYNRYALTKEEINKIAK